MYILDKKTGPQRSRDAKCSVLLSTPEPLAFILTSHEVQDEEISQDVKKIR